MLILWIIPGRQEQTQFPFSNFIGNCAFQQSITCEILKFSSTQAQSSWPLTLKQANFCSIIFHVMNMKSYLNHELVTIQQKCWQICVILVIKWKEIIINVIWFWLLKRTTQTCRWQAQLLHNPNQKICLKWSLPTNEHLIFMLKIFITKLAGNWTCLQDWQTRWIYVKEMC